MTVKELIEKLQEVSPDLDVYMYNSLDEGGASAEMVETHEGEFANYCKGDPPFCISAEKDKYGYNKPPGYRYVLISGE